MDKDKLARLVKDYRDGNAPFDEIYRMTWHDLYVYALYIVKEPEKAEDLLQDTYILILRHLDQLKEPSRFTPWSKSILYHEAIRKYNLESRAPLLLDDDNEGLISELADESHEAYPEDMIIGEEVRTVVLSAIKELPPEQGVTLLAYYYDSLSITDIAEMTGAPEGTVKTRLYYGRKALKEKIEEYEKEHGKLRIAVPPFLLIGDIVRDQLAALGEPESNAILEKLSHMEMEKEGAVSSPKASAPAGQGGTSMAKGIGAAGKAISTKALAGALALTMAAGGIVAFLLTRSPSGSPGRSVSSTPAAEKQANASGRQGGRAGRRPYDELTEEEKEKEDRKLTAYSDYFRKVLARYHNDLGFGAADDISCEYLLVKGGAGGLAPYYVISSEIGGISGADSDHRIYVRKYKAGKIHELSSDGTTGTHNYSWTDGDSQERCYISDSGDTVLFLRASGDFDTLVEKMYTLGSGGYTLKETQKYYHDSDEYSSLIKYMDQKAEDRGLTLFDPGNAEKVRSLSAYRGILKKSGIRA